MSFQDACTFDAFHAYDRLQEICDAYFLLESKEFEDAWLRGMGTSGKEPEQTRLF